MRVRQRWKGRRSELRSPPRGASRRDRGYDREERLTNEPFAADRGSETASGRGSRETAEGEVRRKSGRDRSGSRSAAGLYGSRIGANMVRAGVAEVVGTAILVYAGTTVAVAASLAVPAVGTSLGSLAAPLTFGLVLVALVAALGAIIVAWDDWDMAPVYTIAPIVGGVLAASLYEGFISRANTLG